MAKIKFTGWVEIPIEHLNAANDQGTIDNWLADAVEDAAELGEWSEDGFESLRHLHIKSEVDRNGN